METLLIILGVIALLFVIYALAVRGRTGNPGLKPLQGWAYAHRGLHNDTRPENSMAAFKAALEKGYGIELDIHLLKDGNLAVIHDASLKRTAGEDVLIEDLTTEDLSKYHLEGTEETIPTFRQVLDLYDGKAPIIVELKAERGNHAALVDTAVEQLRDYKGVYCVESFDPRCILHLKKNHCRIVRGQLTRNFLAVQDKLPWVIKFMLTYQLSNFLSKPDFVSYRFADRKTLGNFLVRKLWGVQGVTWTVRSLEDHKKAVAEGWIPIFEGYEP